MQQKRKDKKADQNQQEEQQQPQHVVKEEKPISEKHSLKQDPKAAVPWINEQNSFILGTPDTKIFCCKFDYNDKYIACACENGQVRIYNVQKRQLSYVINATSMTTVSSTNPKPVPFSYVRWRPPAPSFKTRNIFITSNTIGEVQHFHLTSGKCLGTMRDTQGPLENQLYCMDYNFDATKIAVCGSDPVIRIFDEEKRCVDIRLGVEQTQPPGHGNRVYSVKYHKMNANLLLSGGWDRRVVLWDIRMKKPEANQIYGPLICGDGIDIKDSEQKILTASWTEDKQLQIWDLRQCSLCSVIDWDSQLKTSNEPSLLYCGQFSKFDEGELILAGGSGSNETKIFNTLELDKAVVSIYDMSRDINTLDFANKERQFAISGGDGYLRVFEINNQQ